MVSLEQRQTVLHQICSIQKVKKFYDLLSTETFELPQNLSKADEIYFSILLSLIKNDRQSFIESFIVKSKSNPTSPESSPFVNDDYLIFSLILGIKKFQLETDWIKNVLEIRPRNDTTITFKNILSDNFLSRSNKFEIILVFLNIYNPKLIDNGLLDLTYKQIIDDDSIFERSDYFKIITSQKAYDLIVGFKFADTVTVDMLTTFQSNFYKRIIILSWFLRALVLFILFHICFALLSKIPSSREFFEQYDTVFTVMGVIGFTFLGEGVPSIKTLFIKILLWIFGVPKNLEFINKKKL